MKSDAFLEKLKSQVGDPEWPERLLPLFMFRGASRPQRIHALWNIAYAMYLREVESFGDAIKTFNTLNVRDYKGKPRTFWDGPPNEVAHFCGLHAHLQHTGLHSIFGRLRSAPALTDSVDKGFTEYVEWLHPYPCVLIPVGQQSDDTRTRGLAWWRTPRPLMKRRRKPKEAAWYMKDAPSMPAWHRNTGSADAALMQHIHRIVPAGLSAEMRGDLCQDLLVAVLSGETSVANLPEMMNRYARVARKMLPDLWKTVSLDAVIHGTDGLTMMDDLGACHDHF